MPSPIFDGMGETVMGGLKEATDASFIPLVSSPGGDPVPLEIIFKSAFQDVDVLGQYYGAPRPVAWYMKSAGIAPKHGDKLDVAGHGVYTIRSVEPDALDKVKVELSI